MRCGDSVDLPYMCKKFLKPIMGAMVGIEGTELYDWLRSVRGTDPQTGEASQQTSGEDWHPSS